MSPPTKRPLDNEGEEVPLAKRARGRPRKIIDQSQALTPANGIDKPNRGPGRPKKVAEVAAVDHDQQDAPVVKRAKGRPRKTAEASQTITQPKPADQPKRKRGRPKKNAGITAENPVETSDAAESEMEGYKQINDKEADDKSPDFTNEMLLGAPVAAKTSSIPTFLLTFGILVLVMLLYGAKENWREISSLLLER